MSNRTSVEERPSVPAEASRRGAHRARPRGVPSVLPIVAGAAVILLVVGAAYALLSSGSSPGSTANISGAQDDATPTASGSSTAAATPAATAPAASATPSSRPSQTRTAAPVDRTARVSVLNSVPVQGLAARVRANLVAAGWRVSSTGNSQTRNLPVTKVYYRKASMRRTAQKLADDLQFGQIGLDPGAAGSTALVVVLGRDAE